jgi:hypothetical protein
VNDGVVDSTTATITVTIAVVNDAPVAQNGTADTFAVSVGTVGVGIRHVGDTFTFRAKDGTINSNTATVTATKLPRSTTHPVTSDITLTTLRNLPVNGMLPGVDVDGMR